MLWLSDAQGGKAAAPRSREGYLTAFAVRFSASSEEM
jgi:hypothetical protein